MTTPAEYRDFAIDCLRWTETAKDAAQRQTLMQIGRLWMNAASLMDQHLTLVADKPALLRELRAKLD
jgi:hypothetical protein